MKMQMEVYEPIKRAFEYIFIFFIDYKFYSNKFLFEFSSNKSSILLSKLF